MANKQGKSVAKVLAADVRRTLKAAAKILYELKSLRIAMLMSGVTGFNAERHISNAEKTLAELLDFKNGLADIAREKT